MHGSDSSGKILGHGRMERLGAYGQDRSRELAVHAHAYTVILCCMLWATIGYPG